MELNQEKFVTNYVKNMKTLYTHLEKRDKETKIMKIKHSDHVTDMQSQHAEEMETMKANHDRKRSSMQAAKLLDDHKSR